MLFDPQAFGREELGYNPATMSSIISEILQHNRSFVANKEYEAFRTDQFPNKRLVVLTCMDTRLVELLPRAMGFRNGDVKLVKNAGAIVSHPFGSVMRSILLAIYELMADEVVVVGHSGCGMTGLSCDRVLEKAALPRRVGAGAGHASPLGHRPSPVADGIRARRGWRPPERGHDPQSSPAATRCGGSWDADGFRDRGAEVDRGRKHQVNRRPRRVIRTGVTGMPIVAVCLSGGQFIAVI